jgi:hypothetical protein
MGRLISHLLLVLAFKAHGVLHHMTLFFKTHAQLQVAVLQPFDLSLRNDKVDQRIGNKGNYGPE